MLFVLASLLSCSPEQPAPDIYAFANGCYTVARGGATLQRSGESYGFAKGGTATPLFFRPSDLGSYLLHDPEGGYVVREGEALIRQEQLESDITRFEDGYISGGEWLLEPHEKGRGLQLRSKQEPTLRVARDGLTTKVGKVAGLTLTEAEGCTAPPELGVHAEGTPTMTTFEDGDVFGYVDAHSHIFSNFGFGGTLFHGSPFHPLGVEHALPDCSIHHGEAGRGDLFGYSYDNDDDPAAFTTVVGGLVAGELAVDNHATAGFPQFTEWPDARHRGTHQQQYHKWLERAWLSGLRLVVQHATSNSIICEATVGGGLIPGRYDCSDMTGVDRQLDGVYAMERYLDAQAGGPGKGWFRIVTSPQQAREVIAQGKLAVVLGIETSNLFDCYLTPRGRGPTCDLDYVRQQLDAYHDRGVRVLFPVHKYDNAFSAGDGAGGFVEVGNVINSGHYTDKTEDCPGLQTSFDKGRVDFAGLLQPRESYDAPAVLDFDGWEEDPAGSLLSYIGELTSGTVEGEWCQVHGLTPIGEALIEEILARGMVLELDHLPQRSYQQVFERLVEVDYPAVGTHGNTNGGRLYDIAGLSFRKFGRCHDPENPGSSWARRQQDLELMDAAGLHPSLGLSFDLNGFAGGPAPRFGDQANCTEPQTDPVTYPFTSWAGDVTFTEPRAGERTFDFNTEGMIQIGLLPEYIEDARKDAPSEEAVEALFRSAEGYLRLWERSEARASAVAPG